MLPAVLAAGPKPGQKQMAAHTRPGRGRDTRTRTQAHKRGRVAQARIREKGKRAQYARDVQKIRAVCNNFVLVRKSSNFVSVRNDNNFVLAFLPERKNDGP